MRRLLVTVDSLRYDHYDRMDHTRSFLGESHPQAYATATATLGTFPNVFTGTYTKSNEISESFVSTIDDRTVGITTNRLVSDRYGYDTGFDSFTAPSRSTTSSLKRRIARALPEGPVYAAAARVYSVYQSLRDRVTSSGVEKSFRSAASVIEEFTTTVDRDSDWFGWVHLMEPHHPYDPLDGDVSQDRARRASRRAIADGVDEETAQLVREAYEQEIVELDRQLAELWEWIPSDTMVIFTADHGEFLGEDGLWGHPGVLREETLHVPFATTLSVDSPIVSSVDVASYLLGEEYGEGRFDRTTAYASHGEKAAAIEDGLIANPDGVFRPDGTRVEQPDLERKRDRFEPSGIVKSDALEEDLEELGYL